MEVLVVDATVATRCHWLVPQKGVGRFVVRLLFKKRKRLFVQPLDLWNGNYDCFDDAATGERLLRS